MSVLHRKLLREYAQLRGQAIAIALVLIGGIATMVMAMGNHHALADTRATFYREYRFADVFASVRRAPLPLLARVRALPGVARAQARVVGMVSLEVPGFDEAVTAQVVSLPRPGDADLDALYLRRGALPAADDEAVVAEAFADAHGLQPGDRLTAILHGRRQAVRISGVGLSPEFIYQIRPGEAFPDFARFGVLWMRPRPLARAFDLDGAFNDLTLTLAPQAREADVIDAVDTLLAPYGGTGARGRALQTSHRYLDEELRQLAVMTRLFSTIFLAVAAFLLNVVVGRLVDAQREQVAVLEAFGYSRREVALHYFQLVLLLVGTGLLPGIAFGAWMGREIAGIYMRFFRFPFLSWSLPPLVLALAIGFSLAVAALGTLGGLRRIWALTPAQAMRPEAPALYRRSLAERIGLARLLDPSARMVLRTLERRPLRTLLSIAGIGLACGMLVMSGSQRHAIDAMIAVQFGLAQRDDLTVSFVEPTSARAAQELAALPGVRAVEPFRFAAVRLHHGHRSYQTALQGLPGESDLRRVLDRDLHPVALPADGVLLTDYLAGMLDVRPGDRIAIEFLEGDRRTLTVPVAGTVHEYLGVGAYARRATVNRLLGEGGAVSGAWLSVDPAARGAVLAALRARPRVAAVADRAATIRSFRESMAESVDIFTFAATLLAGGMVVGVVYNAARITLAERGRDFASLRVLGYTRAEVRGLLLGELAVLAFLALPLGFACGQGLTALLVLGFQSELYRVPLAVAPAGQAFAGLVVLAATLLSALLVRRRLDRLDLVAVLKTRE
ncbi:MAG TPA: ABC transporter permease [Xanthomonadaceae bacterium]|nr:ABC transporter permease [Xanthomonadaceae bacterium]